MLFKINTKTAHVKVFISYYNATFLMMIINVF